MFTKRMLPVHFPIVRHHTLLIFCSLTLNAFSLRAVAFDSTLVNEFYSSNHHKMYWFASPQNTKRAADWFSYINMADSLGLISDKVKSFQIELALANSKLIDSTHLMEVDVLITGQVLSYIKLYQQSNITFQYDAISVSQDKHYVNLLLRSPTNEPIAEFISKLECADPEYLRLKQYLKDSVHVTDVLKAKIVTLAMNYRKYFAINKKSEYILVNIATNEAAYYKDDQLAISMRVVVGRKSNPTPTIASYITSVVTFPYWNVPRSIALKEILPKAKLKPNYLEEHHYEVVDSKGELVDEALLKWSKYNKDNFPYFFRQATGDENALGVLKFDLQNPYNIYLHDTSNPAAFNKHPRFLSHGCVRLEKPLELATEILPGKIDIEKLKMGLKNIKPKTYRLARKIPTFIIYLPLKMVDNKVQFVDDEYEMIK
jgi:murein L,D-transpeptidase YcbB/YkuD